MKLLSIVLLFVLAAAANTGQPVAIAKLCGNVIIRDEQKTKTFLMIQRQGCEEVRFQYISDGYWLAYGTRVLIGE